MTNDTSGKSEKKLETRERNTLLTIIAALCKYSKIEYEQQGALKQIVKITEENGTPVSDDTIRKTLKQLSDAVANRKK